MKSQFSSPVKPIDKKNPSIMDLGPMYGLDEGRCLNPLKKRSVGWMAWLCLLLTTYYWDLGPILCKSKWGTMILQNKKIDLHCTLMESKQQNTFHSVMKIIPRHLKHCQFRKKYMGIIIHKTFYWQNKEREQCEIQEYRKPIMPD